MELALVPLTAAAFAPFGDVLDAINRGLEDDKEELQAQLKTARAQLESATAAARGRSRLSPATKRCMATRRWSMLVS